jgi:hypothetical protein
MPIGSQMSTILQPEYSNISNIITHQIDADFVDFHHSCFGRPAISAFLKAAKDGYLNGINGLTYQKINRNRPCSPATSKGHLDRKRQNVRSTKALSSKTVIKVGVKLEDNLDPDTDEQVYTQLFSDATGRLLVSSKAGSNNILIFTYKE